MPATITTQTATYTRNRHDYVLNGSSRVGYDSSSIAAKRFAQALASLGMTISVVEDTTAEYDETLAPSEQPQQYYRAQVYDPEHSVGIYVTSNSKPGTAYNSTEYYGWNTFFRTGAVFNGEVSTNVNTASYCFDVGTWTITKQSIGSFVRYIFPCSSISGSTSSSSGSGSYEKRSSTFVKNSITISAFKAANLLTGEIEPFCTPFPLSTSYSDAWFLSSPYNITSGMSHQTVGHTDAAPQPSAEKTLLWQTPLYCGGQLYDKINGGRLFCCGSNRTLPVGTIFTVDGVTLRALDTSWALELI